MIIAVTCRFKRTKDSEFESGIAIVKEVGSLSPLCIVDKEGLYVHTGIWDANIAYQYGCFIIPPDSLFERGGT